MAYLRGKQYIWDDGNLLHVWSADGYDGWDEGGWHRDEDSHIVQEHLENGENVAGGVSLPISVADEFVVMRFAQLLYEGRLRETVHRSVNGNTGSLILTRNAAAILDALEGVALKPAPPYEWDEENENP